MFTDTQLLNWFEEHSTDFRFINDISMDGSYPCWSVYSPAEGRVHRKTLRQAILANMGYLEKCPVMSHIG